MGVRGPLKPDFSHALTRGDAAWLSAQVLPLFVNGEYRIVGSLLPLDRRCGHVLVKGADGPQVVHLKAVSLGNDLELSNRINIALHNAAVSVTSFRLSHAGRVEECVEDIHITMTDYIPARHCNHTLSDAISLGVTLAHAHGVLENFPETEAVLGNTREVVNNFLKTRDQLLVGVPSTIPERWRSRVAEAALHYDPWFEFGGQSQCLHGDLSPGNILFAADGTAVLTDFEQSSFACRPRLFDLGMAVLRFCLEGCPGPDGSQALEKTRAFLNAYCQRSGWSFPLSALEASVRNSIDHAYIVLSTMSIDHVPVSSQEWLKADNWDNLIVRPWLPSAV